MEYAGRGGTRGGGAWVQALQSVLETPTVVSRTAVVGTVAPADCASRVRKAAISPASVESLTSAAVELTTLSEVTSAATMTPPIMVLSTIAMINSTRVNPLSAVRTPRRLGGTIIC